MTGGTAFPKDWRSKKICLHHGSVLPPATACSGDSGGPLIVNEGGYSVVIGVTSFGYDPTQSKTETCNPKGVSVYGEVQAYLPWIKNIIGQGQNPTPRNPNSCYYVTKSVKWRYLGNQAWYHRSACVKTTGKNSESENRRNKE